MKNKNPFLVTRLHGVFVARRSKLLQHSCNILFPFILVRQIFFGGNAVCCAFISLACLFFLILLKTLDSPVRLNQYDCLLSVVCINGNRREKYTALYMPVFVANRQTGGNLSVGRVVI